MFFYNLCFFFGIPNTESRSRGFGIGIFYFWLDRKIPKILKSRGSGSGLENLESKIPILGLTVFWPSGFFRDFLKIPRIRDYFKSWNFYPLDSKFFISVEIFIPGIRDFNPGDSGFFLISGFLFPGFSKNLRDLCEILVIFVPGISSKFKVKGVVFDYLIWLIWTWVREKRKVRKSVLKK